jgi:hypothetical protein
VEISGPQIDKETYLICKILFLEKIKFSTVIQGNEKIIKKKKRQKKLLQLVSIQG